MSNKELSLKQMIAQVSDELKSSKKTRAEIKNKLDAEETILIGLKIKLEKLTAALRSEISAHPIEDEEQQRTDEIDSAFRIKFDDLNKKIQT